MWVGLAHCALGAVWNIEAEDDIVEGEGDGGSVGEMRQCKGGWYTSMFVKEDNIGET